MQTDWGSDGQRKLLRVTTRPGSSLKSSSRTTPPPPFPKPWPFNPLTLTHTRDRLHHTQPMGTQRLCPTQPVPGESQFIISSRKERPLLRNRPQENTGGQVVPLGLWGIRGHRAPHHTQGKASGDLSPICTAPVLGLSHWPGPQCPHPGTGERKPAPGVLRVCSSLPPCPCSARGPPPSAEAGPARARRLCQLSLWVHFPVRIARCLLEY